MTVSVALCVPPLMDAEMLGVWIAVTTLLVTVKVAVVAPDATVTLAGTVAQAVLELSSVTFLCAVVPAAAPFRVMVAIEFAEPPFTLDGFRVIAVTISGFTVSVAVADPFNVAVITELATVAATRDFTVNVAVVAPDATVTLAGTVAAAVLLLVSVTVLCDVEPAAGTVKVTVPIELLPPTTPVGLRLRDCTAAGGVTVSATLRLLPLSVAEIFTTVGTKTARLVTVKVFVVAPTVKVTLAGTVAAAVLSLASVTVLCAVVPAEGAFNVIVPVALVVPPTTLVRFRVRAVIKNGFTANVAVADPNNVAVMTELVAVLTTLDVTVNVAVVAPAATDTLAGTVAAAVLPLDSVTVVVTAAGAFNVTVPVEFADPPTTLVGLSVRD